MLDSQNHQGKFGQDYVRALASAAGLIVFGYDLDIDGVDLGFRLPGPVGHVVSPAIEVQVKSWSRPRPAAGEWYFDGLNAVQFNKLAGSDYTIPRFLFLVCVPSRSREYATFQTDGMLLRQLGYFYSLEHEARIAQPDKARRRPVRVPMSNVLTIQSLLSLVRPRSADMGQAG